MTDSLRDFNGALAFARAEAEHPSQDWTGYCQMFVRFCYGIPALFGTAYLQWLGADDEDKHVGGHPDDAPLGSALIFKGLNPAGHIDLAGRPFKSGVGGAWSNDLVVTGNIDKVRRDAPTTHWGQTYLGYLTAVNDYDLRLKQVKPPKPKQDKRYRVIEGAIHKMERALETAVRTNDRADARVIRKEIRELKKLYATLRHS